MPAGRSSAPTPKPVRVTSAVLSEPTGTITMSPDVDDVIVCGQEPFVGDCYRIPGVEFARLVAGGAPSPGAPVDFQYTPWPVFVTVSGGEVTAVADQYVS